MSTEKAYQLALKAHDGQFRKNGWEPYINHPVRVANSVKHFGEEYEIVGLLHDVVEDTPISLLEIEEQFGLEIAKAVDSVSRQEGELYFNYIERAKANRIGKQVKIADLKDNSDPIQLDVYTEDEKKFKLKRYRKALSILEDE